VKSLRVFAFAWYAQEFLRELVLIYPVYAIMMVGTAGITPFDLSLLFFAWSATALLFEVPSGTLADRFPRRLVLLAGSVLKALCFLIWWRFPSFEGYLAGFIGWGIGGALRSGCAESLLYDKLVELDRERDFERIYGRGEAANAVAVALAMVLGGWLARDGWSAVLVLSAGAPLAAAMLVLLFVQEPPRSGRGTRGESYLETMRAGLREVRGGQALRRPILYLCTVALVYEVLEEYFGPFLSESDLSLTAIGLIMAVTNIARAAGAAAAGHLSSTTLRNSARLFALAACLLGAAALVSGWPALLALTGFVGLAAAGKVLVQGGLQRAIAGHARATITSVATFSQELSSLVLFLAIGAVATRGGWSASFAWTALALAGAAVLLGLSEPREPGTRN
jgi:MFS family permease